MDPHGVLGVASSATCEEIQKAYKTRAKEIHPDKRPADEQETATQEFQQLLQAYETLMRAAPTAAGGGRPQPDNMAKHGTAFSHVALDTFFLPRDFGQISPGEDDDANADILASVERVSDTWCEPLKGIISSLVHRPTKYFMLEKLQALQVKQAAAFWLRAQNAVLHIERFASDMAMVRAWRVQLPSAEVKKMLPPCMAVPAIATRARWERVAHEAFCQVAAFLAIEELPQAAAQGDDPSLPVVIIDYLLPVVCGETVDLSTCKFLWKKATRHIRSCVWSSLTRLVCVEMWEFGNIQTAEHMFLAEHFLFPAYSKLFAP